MCVEVLTLTVYSSIVIPEFCSVLPRLYFTTLLNISSSLTKHWRHLWQSTLDSCHFSSKTIIYSLSTYHQSSYHETLVSFSNKKDNKLLKSWWQRKLPDLLLNATSLMRLLKQTKLDLSPGRELSRSRDFSARYYPRRSCSSKKWPRNVPSLLFFHPMQQFFQGQHSH